MSSSHDEKKPVNESDRNAEFMALAKEYKTADHINQFKILNGLIDAKDEEALIWLYQNKIFDLRVPYYHPAHTYRGEWMLRDAIQANLTKFVEYICQNTPEAFERMDYTTTNPDRDPISFYQYKYVDFAPSADMVGLFIKYLPGHDVNHRRRHDSTTKLLDFARDGSLIDVVKLVLLYGANVHYKYLWPTREGGHIHLNMLELLVWDYIPSLTHVDPTTLDPKRNEKMMNYMEIIRFLAAEGAASDGLERDYESMLSYERDRVKMGKKPTSFVQCIVGLFKTTEEAKPEIISRMENVIGHFKKAIEEGRKLGSRNERYKEILEASQSMGVNAPGISELILQFDSTLSEMPQADQEPKKPK